MCFIVSSSAASNDAAAMLLIFSIGECFTCRLAFFHAGNLRPFKTGVRVLGYPTRHKAFWEQLPLKLLPCFDYKIDTTTTKVIVRADYTIRVRHQLRCKHHQKRVEVLNAPLLFRWAYKRKYTVHYGKQQIHE